MKRVRRHVLDVCPRVRERSTKRKRRKKPEEAVQVAIVEWARGAGLKVLHVNNGSPSLARRVQLARMGCEAGAADLLMFDVGSSGFLGVAIEVKADGGVQSDDQIAWEESMVALGWAYMLVRSLDEAKSQLMRISVISSLA